jgi:pimeloyl-ACP methyl ester carboxylesterase
VTHWLLLRGLAREAAHWGALPRLLAQRGGGVVVPLDLPGAGSEYLRRSPASVAAIAADCAYRWRPPARERTVCIALSLGAMVALEWLRQRPGAFDALVLVNTSAGGVSPFWHRLQPRHYPTLLSLLAPGLPVARREQRVLAMTSADPGRHPGVVRWWTGIARQRPVATANALRQVWAAAR